MKDIETRRDLENLMADFYSKALIDEVIGYIFIDVAKLDLEHHLPIIVDFWEMMLFGKTDYQTKYGRNPMQVHIALSKKEPLIFEHFERWLKLFNEAVDSKFSGENSQFIKQRAKAIANTMLLKVSSDNRGVVRGVQE